MGAAAGAGKAKPPIKDDLAMAAIRHAIVNDELPNDGNRIGKAIGNGFRYINTAAVPRDPLAGGKPAGGDVADIAAPALCRGMVGGGACQHVAGRKRRQRGLALDKADGLVDGAHALPRHVVAGFLRIVDQQAVVAFAIVAQHLDIGLRLGAGIVDLVEHGLVKRQRRGRAGARRNDGRDDGRDRRCCCPHLSPLFGLSGGQQTGSWLNAR